ncbi:MAG: antibiotic biosynthesis monooxygenase [Rhodobacteraceae bacterium]|nr:antibiotic biosynthesis monooxygenase [Paracoccaceae bacterium]
MLIVTGKIELNSKNIAAARKAIAAVMAETVVEDGCQTYEFSQVVGTDATFRVYEEWDDAAALAAHAKAPHMAVFSAALGEVGVVSRALWTIEAGTKSPLG